MYVCADEALSKSKEIRKAYKEEKPNCGRERERERCRIELLCEMVNL